jgi:hypothetical protein
MFFIAVFYWLNVWFHPFLGERSQKVSDYFRPRNDFRDGSGRSQEKQRPESCDPGLFPVEASYPHTVPVCTLIPRRKASPCSNARQQSPLPGRSVI